MASIRSRIVREITHQYMKRQWIQTGSDAGRGRKSVATARRDFERRMSLLPTARDVRLEREQIAGIDCEWHVPKGCAGSPLIYYLHGGGFVVGGPGTHRRLVSHIAREAKMRAVVPDYRLSPENPFPAVSEAQIHYSPLCHGSTALSPKQNADFEWFVRSDRKPKPETRNQKSDFENLRLT